MKTPSRAPEIPRTGEDTGAHDPELAAALKKVLEVVYKDHPLSSNQLLVLASELQRIGVHRLVEEHIRKFRQRQEASEKEL